MTNIVAALNVGASIITAGGMIAWENIRPLSLIEQEAAAVFADETECIGDEIIHIA